MTTDILHTIVAHKRTEIALQEEAVSQDFLIQQLGTPRPSKSLKQALAASPSGIIAEFNDAPVRRRYYSIQAGPDPSSSLAMSVLVLPVSPY